MISTQICKSWIVFPWQYKAGELTEEYTLFYKSKAEHFWGLTHYYKPGPLVADELSWAVAQLYEIQQLPTPPLGGNENIGIRLQP